MLKPSEVKSIVDARNPAYIVVDGARAEGVCRRARARSLNIPMEQFAAKSDVLSKRRTLLFTVTAAAEVTLPSKNSFS